MMMRPRNSGRKLVALLVSENCLVTFLFQKSRSRRTGSFDETWDYVSPAIAVSDVPASAIDCSTIASFPYRTSIHANSATNPRPCHLWYPLNATHLMNRTTSTGQTVNSQRSNTRPNRRKYQGDNTAIRRLRSPNHQIRPSIERKTTPNSRQYSPQSNEGSKRFKNLLPIQHRKSRV